MYQEVRYPRKAGNCIHCNAPVYFDDDGGCIFTGEGCECELPGAEEYLPTEQEYKFILKYRRVRN